MDDREFIKAVIADAPGARERFVKIWRPKIFSKSLKILGDQAWADDACQVFFIRVFANIHSFRFESSLNSWLHIVSLNVCLNLKRESYVSRRDDLWCNGEPYVEARSEASDPEDMFSNRELYHAAIHIIYNLPDRQRQAVVLRLFEDLSFEDIAKVMRCPYNTAKANFRHGLLTLRSLLLRQVEPQISLTRTEREPLRAF